MSARVVNVRQARDTMTPAERAYLPEILRGMGVTFRHFFANTFGRKYTVTLEYPEEKEVYPERFRGRHRLMVRDDGQVRCVACMCCSTACPTSCITIEAGEHEDPKIEKYPVRFDINHLRCIFCGMCVEACPCDAIRMDTQTHVVPHDARGEFVVHKEDLIDPNGPSKAVQGGAGR
jgi:NADH-quinone oxidoreductase subunit I